MCKNIIEINSKIMCSLTGEECSHKEKGKLCDCYEKYEDINE